MRKNNILNAFIFVFILSAFIFNIIPSKVFADSGVWTQQTGAEQHTWTSIASSSDGTKLVAVSGQDRGNDNYIYTSTNSGVTWTQQTVSGSHRWIFVASSSDGTKLAASDFIGGYIYTSSDSGVTWTQRTTAGSNYWSSIASSSDGIKLVAVNINGYIYTSSDSGVTWTQRINNDQYSWSSIASSSDGTKLTAADQGNQGGYIYTSSNSGVTWTPQIGSGQYTWVSVVSSYDGTKLAAADQRGYIYTSSDSGVTWIPQTDVGSPHFWTSIASSSDGTKLAATDGSSSDGMNNGYIYTYGSITTPVLKNLNISETSNTIILNGFSTAYNTTNGFQYGLDTNYGTTTTQTGAFGFGLFSTNISTLSLLENVIYHYRSYATNSAGTGYGSDATFIVKILTQQTGAGQHTWTSIASSSDGTKLVASDGNNGYIYTSSNSGITWIQRTSAGSHNWSSITSSSDGKKLAALGIDDFTGYLYTSSNSGITWTQQIAPGRSNFITSSANGTKLIAGDAGLTQSIYTSSNSGIIWTQQVSAGNNSWSSIASSSDGTKLAATSYTYDGYIYTSSDSGITWIKQTSSGSHSWSSIASSSDGTKLAAVVSGGYIYTSSDSGVNWIKQANSGQNSWSSIASSSDGTKLAAVNSNGYIYASFDSGVTWTQQIGADQLSWTSIVMSSDGSKIAVVGNGTSIYTTPLSFPSPVVITLPASSITTISVTLNGEVTNTGGDIITTRGFNYGTDIAYGTDTIENGTFDIGIYTLALSSLSCGTTYHYRAYAVNSTGTEYGDDQTFTTGDCISTPTVATTFTFTGPSSGNVKTNSSNFTVTPNNGQYTGIITITPTGEGSTGLSPIVLTFNASSVSQTFTIKPTVSGLITLTPTNDGSLTNPSSLSYSANKISTGGGSGGSSGSSSGSSSVISGSLKHGCSDPKALNYETLVFNDPSLCKYTPSDISLITKILKIGVRGDEVKIIQNYFNNLLQSNLTTDGIFGNKTKLVVLSFQKINGLKVDGIVGPNTLEKMK